MFALLFIIIIYLIGTPVAYTSVPANTYAQSNFTNSQTDVGGQNVTMSEAVKSYGKVSITLF